MSTSPITIETVVKAPIEKVWEYWSSPEHITKWATPSSDWEAPSAENDLKTGGKFKTRMSAKDKSAGFDFLGTYTEVKEHELIEYDLEDKRHVKTTFTDSPEGVKIVQIFDPEQENPPDFQKAGWQAILDNFKNYTEANLLLHMRKIIVLSFLSLDGVMQAPGGPKEDPSGGFKFGGWTFPFFDEFAGKLMGEQMSGEYDLLLGRKTYQIFSSYWPTHTEEWPQVNKIAKYVVSTTLENPEWENTSVLKDIEAVKKLKEDGNRPLQIHGSGALIRSLLQHDMVDELWLKAFPVVLGKGKRLFDEKGHPGAFTLVDSQITPQGVIFASYKRAGDIKTGSFGD